MFPRDKSSSYVCVVHAWCVLKGVGHHDNASLQTRGWLPWKPRMAEGKEEAIDGEGVNEREVKDMRAAS